MSVINYKKKNRSLKSNQRQHTKKYSPVTKSRTKLVISIEVLIVSSSKGVLSQLHNQSHKKGHQVETNHNPPLIKNVMASHRIMLNEGRS